MNRRNSRQPSLRDLDLDVAVAWHTLRDHPVRTVVGSAVFVAAVTAFYVGPSILAYGVARLLGFA